MRLCHDTKRPARPYDRNGVLIIFDLLHVRQVYEATRFCGALRGVIRQDQLISR